MMQTPIDLIERQRQQMAEQAAAAAAARKSNVNRFVELWLTLGVDLLKVAGSNRHNAELQEAQGIAAGRWNGLVGMESQIQREEAALAGRPKKRPTQPGDDVLPDRTLEKQGQAWEEQTKYLHASLADLRKLAAAERKELEGFISKARR